MPKTKKEASSKLDQKPSSNLAKADKVEAIDKIEKPLVAEKEKTAKDWGRAANDPRNKN